MLNRFAPPLSQTPDPIAQARDLARAGRKSEASVVLRRLLSQNARDSRARKALVALGPRFARSKPKLSPQERKVEKSIAAALNKGHWERVIAEAQGLLKRQPLLGDTANALGNALRMTGRNAEAMRAYDHALRTDPALVDSYINISSLLLQSLQPKAALEAAQAGHDVDSDNANVHHALGLALFELERVDECERHLRRAIALAPRKAHCRDALCRILERLNRTEDLDLALAEAVAACPDAPLIKLHQGIALSRAKDHAGALEVLDSIEAGTLPLLSQTALHEWRGRALDALNETEAAFEAFNHMNALQHSVHVVSGEENSFSAMVEARLGGLSAWDDWHRPPAEGPQPVFLVGFPRSGTTLLDTILRNHDRIAVVEEQPMHSLLSEGIANEAEMAGLAGLGHEARALRRAKYFRAFENHIGAPLGDRIALDKMPLNLAEAGAIAAHFPGAKFILALRNPMDCVLSCYMQNFKPNAAMNNFLDLEGTARLYDRLFTLWEGYRSKLDLDVVEVRYEHLIRDLRGAVAPVLTHLGLTWRDEMMEYKSAALARPVIHTPSYKQVTQDLYHSADGRWRRYEPQLTGVADVLKPWLNRWGYASGAD